MSRRKPGTVPARGVSTALDAPEFIPYVYGAASGRPSRARPERVLAAVEAGIRQESAERRFEQELAALRGYARFP